MIKAIVFDNNGVLTSCDADCTIPRFANYFGMEPGDLLDIYNSLAIPADLGKITTDDFLRNLTSAVGKEYNHDELWAIFWGCYKPKQGVREMLLKLKDKFQIALLTNFVDVFDSFNQDFWHYDDIFDDKMFVSSKLGMAKPNDDIFLYALKKLGRKPGEVIFVDDRPSNIEAAEKVGIKGVLFESIDQMKCDLTKLTGVNI